jgi:ADP-ribosyl-[dinitrogen reductase] hydrolase
MRTSASDPLRIDTVTLDGGGRIGMTLCPGKTQCGAWSGDWARDLDGDLGVIAAWGADAIVNLLEDHEMHALGVADTASLVPSRIEYLRLPIEDMGIPGAAWEAQWQADGSRLRSLLTGGGAVLLHCKGGLGRTGLVAARLLMELRQCPAAEAMATVRRARPHAIETGAQEDYLRSLE